MSDRDYPQIFFGTRFDETWQLIYETPLEERIHDERSVAETFMKGWISIQIETEAGTRYELYFTDLVRLREDTELSLKQGEPCFTESGLVVLPEVTPAAIERAVRFLWEHKKESFFSYLKPIENI